MLIRGFAVTLGLLCAFSATRLWSQVDTKSSAELPYFWVFLTTGKSIAGVARADIESMQAEHLGNFGRLHGEGKLFTAGPLSDPEKKLRGIVIVKARDRKSVDELFVSDPLVSKGYLVIDATAMELALGTFYGNVDPKSLSEYRMVLLESASEGKEASKEDLQENLDYCKSIHDDQRLCFAAWLDEPKERRRGILIFRKMEDNKLTSLITELPTVKSNLWQSRTMPLFMSDGIVK